MLAGYWDGCPRLVKPERGARAAAPEAEGFTPAGDPIDMVKKLDVRCWENCSGLCEAAGGRFLISPDCDPADWWTKTTVQCGGDLWQPV
jgi:hypothetical protein